MSWEHLAKHKCGNIVDIPFGNTDFLTKFNVLCEKCGNTWKNPEIETFIGRYVWKPKLFDPFNMELEIKK